jgi:hypothetical protein
MTDIYYTKILPDSYKKIIYTKTILNNSNIQKYLNSRNVEHKKNMYRHITNQNNNNQNNNNQNNTFKFVNYQKIMDLNNLNNNNNNNNDIFFNSCIYTHNYNGELGCTKDNKNLNMLYFKNQQKKDKAILKSVDRDIYLLDKVYL